MKKTLTCPKCDDRVILHIERMRLPVAQPGLHPVGHELPLAVRFSPFSGAKCLGGFETFICRACGYTEWYADGTDTIEPDEKLGIRLIDNRPKATLR